MKHLFKLSLLALLVSLPAYAQDEISQSTGIIGNGRLLGAQSYDGQATVGVLGIDSSGNTVIKAMSGKTVSLAASTTPAADNTYDVGSASLGYRTGYFDTSVITPLASSAASLQIQVDADPQRLFTFDASSDTALTQTFGDGGVTAGQVYTISASTADADDDATLRLASGGSTGDSRGGWCRLLANEVASTGGSIECFLGNVATADFKVALEHASSDFVVADTTSGTLFSIINAGAAVLAAGDYRISGAGTLALQEATAGTKCMGTATANGTTAVPVATTCATTGSRIILTRSSAPSGTAICWQTNIVNATSFDLDCSAAETGTFDWMIVHESP